MKYIYTKQNVKLNRNVIYDISNTLRMTSINFFTPSRPIPLPLPMGQPRWHKKRDGDLLWGGVWIVESSNSSPLLGPSSSNHTLPAELPILGLNPLHCYPWFPGPKHVVCWGKWEWKCHKSKERLNINNIYSEFNVRVAIAKIRA